MARPFRIATASTFEDGSNESLMTSAQATLQHVGMLNERARKLDELRIAAEMQLLHRVGAAFASGQLDMVGLQEIYHQYASLGLPGKSNRWNGAVSVPWNAMRYAGRWIPNGPEGTFVGTWPLENDDPAPYHTASVVYVLFDALNEPVYVGSTGNMRGRLKAHAKAGKQFAAWQAYVVEHREAAYELEVKLLRERLPRLNKRVGR